MRLKIGELAGRVGLSVRALHHYDAIGLLSPAHRSAGGARLYGHEDLVRLHRIEALKRFGYSLQEIRTSLDDPQASGQPLPILRRQIAALATEAARIGRLSRQLQHLADSVAAGHEAPSMDWLNALELMNMYQKHLDERELDTLLDSGPDTLSPTDPAWTGLIDEVRRAMAQGLPGTDAAAQALAWRWIRLVVRMTRNDPALADKLMRIQLGEARARQLTGVGSDMLDWIDEAFAHARCTLLARHLSPAQADEVRRRHLASVKQRAWPALVIELRGLMAAGMAPGTAPVQALIERWQQLFRDSFCGEDALLEAQVRQVLAQEPDLQLGLGMDDALLAFVHQAHLAAQDTTPGDGGPKPSALMVALQRAAHQLLDRPLVFEDPVALAILGAPQREALHAELARYRLPMSLGVRSQVVVRSRLAADLWAEAVAAGTRQYVILGAGLDTSAWRQPEAPGRVFEVDLPATQQWKQTQLREAGLALPSSLSFVPVDFERVSLAEGLAAAGFRTDQPALFSWLGVTMYLDEAAVIETLRFVAGCAPGSTVLLEYATPLSDFSPMVRAALEALLARLAERGEPWKSFFTPEAMAGLLQSLGFDSEHRPPEELNRHYLANRQDGLHIDVTPSRLIVARR